MSTGIVRSFDSMKGYGFIRPDDGARDVIVHAATVAESGLEVLQVGQKVAYILRHDPRTRKNAASELRPR